MIGEFRGPGRRPSSFPSLRRSKITNHHSLFEIRRAGSTIARIQTDGTTIWENGNPEEGVKGLTFKEETQHYIKFIAQPGHWGFSATY